MHLSTHFYDSLGYARRPMPSIRIDTYDAPWDALVDITEHLTDPPLLTVFFHPNHEQLEGWPEIQKLFDVPNVPPELMSALRTYLDKGGFADLSLFAYLKRLGFLREVADVGEPSTIPDGQAPSEEAPQS